MDEKIDINQATMEILASLTGIGPVRAERIVAYRSDVHPFEDIMELTAVQGISERMVWEISDLITVNGMVGEAAYSPQLEERVSDEAESDHEIEMAEANDIGEVEVETKEEEETAEAGSEPEEEAPVVVMMLDDQEAELEERSNSAETTSPEAGPSAEPLPPVPAPEIIERRVVETVQRRHVHFWQQFLGVVAGAFFGAFLTLLVLYLFNGTLRFAGESRAADLQLQLDEETSAIRQTQSDMAGEMGDLNGRVTELDNGLAASEASISAVDEAVGRLEEETAVINDRLETIDQAAEKFDSFLTGLRDLLVTLQGLPAVITTTTSVSGTATVTTTVTVTPETTSGTPTPTPLPASTTPEAGGPTRTPRPTATPIIE